MGLRYKKELSSRIKSSRFLAIHCLDDFYYVDGLGIWVYKTSSLLTNNSYSNYQTCRSVRAFRQKLKRCPKGIKFMLVSRFINFDVFGVGTNSKGVGSTGM